ncbi:MAG: SGNH/GDSL hydrolase family protein [Gemmataceae bacterium]
MARTSILLCLIAVGWIQAAAPPTGFALRDGDTVVFLGDSITAARTYSKYIETYTLLRFPQRRVRFINAGWGGDTAAGGLRRLERDVLRHRPGVVIVAYGMNDIGWGVWADAAHKKTYLDSVAGIIAACQKRGVRVFLCSAAITAAPPEQSEKDFLQRMCDEGLALARARGAGTIDVQREMRAVQHRVLAWNARFPGKESLHAADGVHLNDLGQLAMAFAILRGLGAPAEVSSVRLDARRGKVVEASGCGVSQVSVEEGRVGFTRLDHGLPFNHGLFFALQYRFIPLPETLNRYMLAIDGLAPGRWEVRADEMLLGTYTADQLATGVNVASATGNAWQPGGPWAAQADMVRSLTEARHQLALAELHAAMWLPGQSVTTELEGQAERLHTELEQAQRTAARPRPYRFTLTRSKEKGPGS